jgi:hypothetical protein
MLYNDYFGLLSPWGTLSDERVGLSFVRSRSLRHISRIIYVDIYMSVYSEHMYKVSVSPGFVKQIVPYLT